MITMRPKTRLEFKIAIICALPLEADAVLGLFDELYDIYGDIYGRQEGDSNAYSTGRIGKHGVVLAHMSGMGKSSAASVASGLRSSYNDVRLALIVGICGAVPSPSPPGNPIILGDVIISDSVVEFDFGRQYPDKFERKRHVKNAYGRPNLEIRGILSKLRGRVHGKALREKILENLTTLQEKDKTARYPGADQDRLFAATHRHKHRVNISSQACLCISSCSSDDPVCEEALESNCDVLGCHALAVSENSTRHVRLGTGTPTPLVHIGTIGSASTVMKSGEHRDLIAQKDKIIAFEMEGAGVWDSLPCVIIKGACDYADSHKNKKWQEYAAATAASAAKAFLDYLTPNACFVNSERTPSRRRSCSPGDVDESLSKKARGSILERQHPASGLTRAQAGSEPQSTSAPTGSDMRQAGLNALHVPQFDARHANIEDAHAETHEWLWTKSEYLDWQDKNDADVDAKGNNYCHAMHAAIERSDMSIVQVLMERGAVSEIEFYPQFKNLLRCAVRGQNTRITKLLLDRRPLLAARLCEHLEFCDSIDAAMNNDNAEMFKILLDSVMFKNADRDAYDYALVMASDFGREDIVRMLLPLGAGGSIAENYYGRPLMLAARNGHEPVVRMFLDHGADVNQSTMENGYVLQMVSGRGNDSVLLTLIEYGANVNAFGGPHGSALCIASGIGCLRVACILLVKGADVNNSQDPSSRPLHIALALGYTGITRLLLDYGANVNLPSVAYKDAYRAVEACPNIAKRAECEQLLLERGAKRYSGPNFSGRDILS